MSSSSGDRRDVDSRETYLYMRPYVHAQSRETDGSESQHRQAPLADDDNPFIAFRRYADSQFSSLLQGIIGLPSMLSSPTQRANWPDVEKAKQRANEMRKWGGVSYADDWRQSKDSKSDESGKQGENGAMTSISCPYRSANEPGKDRDGTGVQGVENHSSVQPLEVRWPASNLNEILTDPTSSFNELSYMIFSPYSPLQLANDPSFRGNIDKWMEAYHDLMSIENQQMMPRNEDYRKYSRKYLTSCEDSGRIHVDSDPSHPWGFCKVISAAHPSLRAMLQEKRDAETELDLYENFQGIQSSPNAGDAIASSSSNISEASTSRYSSSTSDKSNPQSIISTLTTTERRTLPDGTVHTKIVLKKRFADGEEESTETVVKSKGNQDDVQQNHSQSTSRAGPPKESAKGSKGQKKGWFWSN
ncbi:MAG: hypothetical protein M1835_005469 [Candelina submexicana]|nr:MAG: hypothetical protein M1835_005469 [Candelina submexicana]